MVLVIPGFIVLWIRDALALGRTSTLLEKTISALICTFINWGLFSMLLRLFPPLSLLLGGKVQVQPTYVASQLWLEFQAQGGFGLLLTSVVLGISWGFVQSKELDYKLVRLLRLSYRTGHTDAWLQTFTSIRGNWLVVHLKDGSRYLGWPKYYSDQAGVHEIFLSDASRIEYDESITNIEGPGILFTAESGITLVEFLHPPGEVESSEEQTGEPEED